MRRNHPDINGTTVDVDSSWYRSRYPDVNGTGLIPVQHFREFGKALGRDSNSGALGNLAGNKFEKSSVRVSVICSTFNHEDFIEDTLIGFIKQDTTFNVEFLIGDDASTDRTGEIIDEYLKKDHRLKHVRRVANLGAHANFSDLINRAQGEYIALCEGDDYWIDKYKLQIQFDFLEKNTEASICFHSIYLRNDASREPPIVMKPIDKELTLQGLLAGNYIHTPSVMYRWRFSGGLPRNFNLNATPQDWYVHLHHAEVGSIGYIDKPMAVYRRHAGGMWASSTNSTPHRRKYGRSQIALFDSIGQKFGGYFRSECILASFSIASDMISSYLIREEYSLLENFVADYPYLTRLYFSYIGVDIGNGSEELSPAHLQRKLFSSITISVLVVCHNQEQRIEAALESVENQRGCFQLEIVVADDASDDKSIEIINKFAARSRHKCVVLTSQFGLGRAFNLKRGIASTTGGYVALCDGNDVWLSENKLIKQLLHLALRPTFSMSFSRLLLSSEPDGKIEVYPTRVGVNDTGVSFQCLLAEPIAANFSSCFYRKKDFEHVPDTYFERDDANCWLFNLYIAKSGFAGFMDEILAMRHIHENDALFSGGRMEQMAATSNLRQSYADLFDVVNPCIASNRVIRVVELTDAAAFPGLLGNLEMPADGDNLNSLAGELRVIGWFSGLSGRVNLALKIDDEFRIAAIDNPRFDVVQSIMLEGNTEFRHPACGFDAICRFNHENILIGFEHDNQIHWRWQITFEQSEAEFKVTILEEQVQQDRFTGHLDGPGNYQTANIRGGKLNLRGWIVDNDREELRLAVGGRDSTKLYALNSSRADVAGSFSAGSEDYQRLIYSGFDHDIDFIKDGSFFVGVAYPSGIHWMWSVNVVNEKADFLVR